MGGEESVGDAVGGVVRGGCAGDSMVGSDWERLGEA